MRGRRVWKTSAPPSHFACHSPPGAKGGDGRVGSTDLCRNLGLSTELVTFTMDSKESDKRSNFHKVPTMGLT